MKRKIAVGIASVALCLSGLVVAQAGAATRTVSASGGSLTFTAAVRNAKTCSWSSSPTIVGFTATEHCKTGTISRSAKFKANTSTRAKSYAITLTVHGKTTTIDHWKVIQARKTKTTTTTTVPSTTTTTVPPSTTTTVPSTTTTTVPLTTPSISTNGTLASGKILMAPSNNYYVAMQTDGNLVEYTSGGNPIWDTQTSGNPGARLVMQNDGNLVIYSTSGTALWSSGTNGSTAEQSLQMQSDGNLVIYRSSSAVWANFAAVVNRPAQSTSISLSWFSPGQCTYWAYQQASIYTGEAKLNLTGDAQYWLSWAQTHGFSTGTAPREFSIAVFQPYVDGADYTGHVAWVTQAYPSNNSMKVTEDNFPYGAIDHTRIVTKANDTPGLSYIYLNP